MLVRDELTLENLYKLVEHQVNVLDRLSSGPVSEKEWHETVKDIFLATGGFLSDRVRRAIRLMSEYGLHEDPYYVKQLYLMLIEEFPETVRFYMSRGWVRPSPPERPTTTLQEPRSLEESLTGGEFP
ncbi:hypothetical protein DRO58_02225 [Candidatus Bathyarchaeota archaeon]|nr:MAG: hypothetical protein DRO58_02225 [Candidatus Bathyarchaeota archaeon]